MTGYPPGMTLRPLDGWPTQLTAERRRAPFQATFTDTLELLERELRMLDPKDGRYPPSVLQIALREQDFRLDGMPRANSYPEHPGVILNIEPRQRPALSFPCDTFDHWHSNLRAITLTLEALRKIDRYGVTQTGQQYTGWLAIEAPKASAKDLIDFLARVADMPPPSSPDGITLAYRKARANAHPDRNAGDREQWDAVERAADQLRRMDWL